MTEKNYYYSASTNAFYPVSLEQDYIDARTFPSDAMLVEDAVFEEFTRVNSGKVRATNEKGLPVWIEAPEPTQTELIAEAEYQKQALLTEATAAIAPLQDAVDLGIATDEEREQLKKWKNYRVLINRVDTSIAPNINWPEKPEWDMR
ncbi:tail fiber assembly protein [Providencia rettgeri]|nr:tail fiber assembly protein [Providencia rettgeri]MDK7745904.1 tail fiber assembly protein [Providencia rettgeri]MDK7758350.1 tail fiber assembly protein [Providencia rettgeri]